VAPLLPHSDQPKEKVERLRRTARSYGGQDQHRPGPADPSFRLIWLEIAEQQYRDLSAEWRMVVDARLAVLLDDAGLPGHAAEAGLTAGARCHEYVDQPDTGSDQVFG
jgi:hypothetical protein